MKAEEMDTANLSRLRPFDFETIVLKDGTRLYGFPSVEYADGSISFNTLISSRKARRNGLEHQVKYTSREQLPGFVRSSLKNYSPFVKTLGIKETIQLAKFPKYNKIKAAAISLDSIAASFDNRYSIEDANEMEDILVLEEGLDSIRYVSFRPSVETIEYADISERITPDLPYNLGYGLRDRVTTSDKRKYLGRITKRHPGKKIVVTSEGTDKTIPMAEVEMTEKMGADPARPIMEQTPFITRCHFNDGTSITGTIVLLNYETGDMSIVTNMRNDTVLRKIDNLDRRENQINPNYPPKKAVKLDYHSSQIYADTILLSPLNVVITKSGMLDLRGSNLQKKTNCIALSGDSITISFNDNYNGAITLTRLPGLANVNDVSLAQMLVKGAAPDSRHAVMSHDAIFCTFKGVKKGYYILSLLKSDRFYLLKFE
ncbi:MAG: hypothetical protein NC342_04915 [Pseudoflavonifractor sp.]|nr:hypothetical protein [Alloprevotella sp.]MCM1116859.1 hypothetical protein [Pseudoflavonifractor sp.]